MPSSKNTQKTTTENQRESGPEQLRESEPEPQPYRPRTRAKNATQHPGAEAMKTLRSRRNPAEIQKEKDARKKKKEDKERARREEIANNEAAARFVEEYRAQQKVTLAKEASIPRRTSQGMRYFYSFFCFQLSSNMRTLNKSCHIILKTALIQLPHLLRP